MGHYIVKFKRSDKVQWGVQKDGKIIPFAVQPHSIQHLLASQGRFLDEKNLERDGIEYIQAELLAPVSSPLRVICQGVNYASHREESALSKSSKGNVMFSKDESAITGAFSRIVRPKNCECLDYEAELALIIKKDIRQRVKITETNLHEYIAGILIANDMSPRDLQYKDDYAQWFKGKSCRTMLPFGPVLYLLDKDDFQYLNNLNIQLWVNGGLRQDANTSQLIFKPAETLTEISEFMNLSVGDVLLTGTPGGVVVKAPSKFLQGVSTWLMSNEQKVATLRKKKSAYLQDGDIIKTRIFSADGKIDLGTQTNKIVPYGF